MMDNNEYGGTFWLMLVIGTASSASWAL